jgi:putative DNA primase/helicase
MGNKPNFDLPEPWHEKVDTKELLDQIAKFFRVHVACPEEADIAVALWLLHTWVINVFRVSPILLLTSPEKRCGKTISLSILKHLVPKPMFCSNATPASIFRAIEKWMPTVILDESDTFLKNNLEINGIINGGHRKDSANIARCMGENHEPKYFSVWCPKILAGIGKFSETLEDRSIIIPMRRKLKSENVKELRSKKDFEELEKLNRKCCRWAKDNLEQLKSINPEISISLNDRAKDNWYPLFAIADLAGPEWIEKASRTSLIFSGDSGDSEHISEGGQLLRDIKDIFDEKKVESIFSEDIVNFLVQREEKWSEYKNFKTITARQIAMILRPYGIQPKQIRIKNTTKKGYQKEKFIDAWNRYVPDQSLDLKETSETYMKNITLLRCLPETEMACVSIKKLDNSINLNKVSDVSGTDVTRKHVER